MKALIGITNHNVAFVSRALERYAKREDIPLKILSVDAKLKKPTQKRLLLLVPTVGGIRANYEVLNGSPNVVTFVFDAAIQCSELKPITLLDVAKNTPSYLFKFKPLQPEDIVVAAKRSFARDQSIKIKHQTINVSAKLLKLTYDSLIASFLTFMYKIPNTDKRLELQDTLFDFLWEGKLNDALRYIEKRYDNEASRTFTDFLRKPIAKQFVAALADIKAQLSKGDGKKKRSVNYAKISKKHLVSKFDLKYIMKARHQKARRKKMEAQ